MAFSFKPYLDDLSALMKIQIAVQVHAEYPHYVSISVFRAFWPGGHCCQMGLARYIDWFV